jgi:hypothetical protein
MVETVKTRFEVLFTFALAVLEQPVASVTVTTYGPEQRLLAVAVV